MLRSLLPSVYRRRDPFFTQRLSSTSIVDQVTDAMKTAMKAKDSTTVATTRLIRSAFQNGAIAAKVDLAALTDDQAQTILRKLAKMRQESIVSYEQNAMDQAAAAEKAELKLIQQWLPVTASAEQTRVWVQAAINEASGGSLHPGKLMGALMKQHKAVLDGKLAKQILQEEIDRLKS